MSHVPSAADVPQYFQEVNLEERTINWDELPELDNDPEWHEYTSIRELAAYILGGMSAISASATVYTAIYFTAAPATVLSVFSGLCVLTVILTVVSYAIFNKEASPNDPEERRRVRKLIYDTIIIENKNFNYLGISEDWIDNIISKDEINALVANDLRLTPYKNFINRHSTKIIEILDETNLNALKHSFYTYLQTENLGTIALKNYLDVDAKEMGILLTEDEKNYLLFKEVERDLNVFIAGKIDFAKLTERNSLPMIIQILQNNSTLKQNVLKELEKSNVIQIAKTLPQLFTSGILKREDVSERLAKELSQYGSFEEFTKDANALLSTQLVDGTTDVAKNLAITYLSQHVDEFLFSKALTSTEQQLITQTPFISQTLLDTLLGARIEAYNIQQEKEQAIAQSIQLYDQEVAKINDVAMQNLGILNTELKTAKASFLQLENEYKTLQEQRLKLSDSLVKLYQTLGELTVTLEKEKGTYNVFREQVEKMPKPTSDSTRHINLYEKNKDTLKLLLDTVDAETANEKRNLDQAKKELIEVEQSLAFYQQKSEDLDLLQKEVRSEEFQQNKIKLESDLLLAKMQSNETTGIFRAVSALLTDPKAIQGKLNAMQLKEDQLKKLDSEKVEDIIKELQDKLQICQKQHETAEFAFTQRTAKLGVVYKVYVYEDRVKEGETALRDREQLRISSEKLGSMISHLYELDRRVNALPNQIANILEEITSTSKKKDELEKSYALAKEVFQKITADIEQQKAKITEKANAEKQSALAAFDKETSALAGVASTKLQALKAGFLTHLNPVS